MNIRVQQTQSTLHRAFSGQTVLVTGHTGFKGSWLSIWLRELGARVIGYSLDPPTVPSNFVACQLAGKVEDIRADVRNFSSLKATIERIQPRFIFHLAAQPLVLPSYQEPKETFDVNAGGTVNLLEAVRGCPSVKAVVCVTTDKVYENREWTWGYREIDRLGGDDPYSSSKAMAELAIHAYRRSFFSAGYPVVASARAGNVIGGGDFADFRLVPDCIKALLAGEPILVRNPEHLRPWQHVLESLSGYLWLAAQMAEHGQLYAGPWNFAPDNMANVSAAEIAAEIISLWGEGSWQQAAPNAAAPQEKAVLRLSREKSAQRLAWRTVDDWRTTLATTVSWFKEFERQQDGLIPESLNMYAASVAQIDDYWERAREIGLPWAAATLQKT